MHIRKPTAPRYSSVHKTSVIYLFRWQRLYLEGEVSTDWRRSELPRNRVLCRHWRPCGEVPPDTQGPISSRINWGNSGASGVHLNWEIYETLKRISERREEFLKQYICLAFPPDRAFKKAIFVVLGVDLKFPPALEACFPLLCGRV